MDDIRFERNFRTPYSESYYIMQGTNLQSNNRIGSVDIHFMVSVYLGKDVGFYSDEYFADENSAEEDFGADDEL